MRGLAEKKTRSARHGTRSISCRLPRTPNRVHPGRRPGAGLRVDRRARPRARATRNRRDDPGDAPRHTAISASIRAGILCAVIRASTKSSPQPRLPADSRHEFETRSLPCSLAATLATLPSISLIPSARFTNSHQLLEWIAASV